MAGLSDMFGDSWEDPKSQAIMALAGGLMGGDWKSGLMGYSKTMAGAGEAKMQSDIKKAQLLKFANDIEMDKGNLALKQGKNKREGDFESVFLDAIKRRLGGGTASPNMPVTGSENNAQGGLMGNTPTQLSGNDPFAGVNEMALMSDYQFNGGKKIGDWVNDRTKPDMKVTDGYAYDNNKLGAGFMPSLRFDASGKALMGRIDSNGLPVFSVPEGALDSYNSYRNADEKVKNKNATTTVTLPDGTTKIVTNEALLDAATGRAPLGRQPQQPMPPARDSNYMSGTSSEQKSDSMRILQSELRSAIAAGDAPLIQGLNREIARLGGVMPTQQQAQNQSPQPAPSFGLELQSLSQKERTSAENDAYKTKLVEQAKADVVPTQAKQANISAAEGALSLIDKALTHKGLGTSVGLSGKVDPRNYIPGTDAKDFSVLADQLKGTAFLTAFERLKGGGAISEREGEKAQSAIARINTAQSEKEFRAALKDYGDVIKVGVSRMKGEEPKQESKSANVPSQPMKGQVISGYKFKGGDPASQASWEKQ